MCVFSGHDHGGDDGGHGHSHAVPGLKVWTRNLSLSKLTTVISSRDIDSVMLYNQIQHSLS